MVMFYAAGIQSSTIEGSLYCHVDGHVMQFLGDAITIGNSVPKANDFIMFPFEDMMVTIAATGLIILLNKLFDLASSYLQSEPRLLHYHRTSGAKKL